MSETQNESPQPLDEETKTPTKRTPSKRLSNVQRAQRESEELIKNMGGSLDVEGGRRTRSSARGSSGPSTPTTNEVKKARTPSTATGRRGRPKKNEASESEENKSHDNESDEASTPKKLKMSDDTESGENCKDNDAASDNDDKGATEKDSKTEVDSKLNSIAEEDLESINPADKKKNATDKKTDENLKEKSSSKIEKPETESTDDDAAVKHEEKNDPAETDKLDPVEPMEVDGGVVSTKKTAPTNEIKNSAQTAIETKQSASEGTEDKNQIGESDGNNEHENEINDEREIQEDVVKTKSTATNLYENSIAEKPAENITAVIDEVKNDESKTENDVCEPKISSPTNATAGEVVAPQPCN